MPWLYENDDYKFGWDSGPSPLTRYKFYNAAKKLREQARERIRAARWHRQRNVHQAWKAMNGLTNVKKPGVSVEWHGNRAYTTYTSKKGSFTTYRDLVRERSWSPPNKYYRR